MTDLTDEQIKAAYAALVEQHTGRDMAYHQRNGTTGLEFARIAFGAGVALAAQQPSQRAEPYAYEFGRDNGDGTYSIVIERGTLVKDGPNSWRYGPPDNPYPGHAVKPLYAAPQPSRQALEPLTEDEATRALRFGPSSKTMADAVTRRLAAKNGLAVAPAAQGGGHG